MIRVIRLGIKYQSDPMLMIEFIKDGVEMQRHHKICKFREDTLLNDDAADSPLNIARILVSSYPDYLGEDQVPFSDLVRLIRRLADELHNRKYPSPTMNTACIDKRIAASISIADTTVTSNIDEIQKFGDLNAVSTEELATAKGAMDIVFDKKRLHPGDDGYEYDKRVDFECRSNNSWDE